MSSAAGGGGTQSIKALTRAGQGQHMVGCRRSWRRRTCVGINVDHKRVGAPVAKAPHAVQAGHGQGVRAAAGPRPQQGGAR